MPDSVQYSLRNAWKRIGEDERSQMKWYVTLARTDFKTLTHGILRNCQEEYAAMVARYGGVVMKVPADRKRYPRSDGPGAVLDLPSRSQMLEVQAVIKRSIDALADGHEACIPEYGGFRIAHSVKFMGNPGYFKHPKTEPRYFIFHNEVRLPDRLNAYLGNSYCWSLALRLLHLLQTRPNMKRHDVYADKLRRCSWCKHVFVQRNRTGRHCSQTCASAAGMKALRERRRAKKKTDRTL
jgi:hypothetical protein